MKSRKGEDMDELDIYSRIDIKLKEKHITRKKMCSDLAIPYGTLNTLYQNKSENISFANLKKIAEYLQCSIDFLAYGVNNKPIPEIESEILKVCSNLTTKQKNKLLADAYKIENEEV